MSRIRLLHLIASGRGGAASHVRELALGLGERFDVGVVMPDDGGNVGPDDFTDTAVRFHPLEIAHPRDWRAMMRLRSLITGQECQLLHLHGARAAFYGRLVHLALPRPRPKLVYSVHGFMVPHYPQPRRLLSTVQERFQAAQVDRFIAVSHAERDALVRAGFPDRIDVVWLGIDTEAFARPRRAPEALRAELGVRPGQLVVMCLCRFFWPRDLATLIQGFARAKRRAPTLRLVLVGDGPWRPQLLQHISAAGLAGDVILPGLRHDVVELLHAADIFTLTSGGGDGLPVSILEAMAAGRPVVATASDGIPEEVVHGETGLLVPKGGVSELAEALVRLARDAPLRERWGAAGRDRVRRHFRRELMITNLAESYGRTLTG
ncbi:MAG: glycosyltransferase [bacterium]